MQRSVISFFESMHQLVLADEEGRGQAEWAKNLKPCTDRELFRAEAIWVILGSGISYRAARSMQKLYEEEGVIRHTGKANAIRLWEHNYKNWWRTYNTIRTEGAKLAFLRTLPYFKGEALIYQFAKNLGITGYCKPDVHLKRLAQQRGYDTPQEMCAFISMHTKHTVAYIDTILWFAAMKRWAYKGE